MIASEEACLQLANPVRPSGDSAIGHHLQLSFELLLVEALFVKAAKRRREATQRSDQSELDIDERVNETKAGAAGGIPTGLGLTVRLGQRSATGEKLSKKIVAAEHRIGEIAGLLRRV